MFYILPECHHVDNYYTAPNKIYLYTTPIIVKNELYTFDYNKIDLQSIIDSFEYEDDCEVMTKKWSNDGYEESVNTSKYKVCSVYSINFSNNISAKVLDNVTIKDCGLYYQNSDIIFTNHEIKWCFLEIDFSTPFKAFDYYNYQNIIHNIQVGINEFRNDTFFGIKNKTIIC